MARYNYKLHIVFFVSPPPDIETSDEFGELFGGEYVFILTIEKSKSIFLNPSNLMSKVLLMLLLLAAAYSLRVGTLSCCPETYVYDEDTLRCVCPLNAPYVSNSGRCIACNAPATWDKDTNTCQKCRADQSEDASGNCLCPKETPYDNGRKCDACPYDLPIWNGKKCVACPPNTNYDVKSKTCTVCPEGLIYDKVDRTCEVKA